MSEPAIALPDHPPRRRLRWLGRLAMMLAGLAVGLAAAELVFRVRDGGAFPHLNVYVADPELGGGSRRAANRTSRSVAIRSPTSGSTAMASAAASYRRRAKTTCSWSAIRRCSGSASRSTRHSRPGSPTSSTAR
jgi:hypothetical protein